ncbi:hypothetical protein [Pelodictyon luteolum]|uniref:Uncharacterized protein n=1 Tax=Chlorobium luteolum (strain DSM 273 / BCRC 81028 / 2530) TaxID=319225 RepID=Q3B1B6_CHLL3|nr:hypothetical protein [Pelodictyon luteolum]ABB24865.1 hypothetical protein Plut_2023 [Pelodictyon luteolum DSM 273]
MDEAKALLAIIGDYSRALGLLDDYDHQRVTLPETSGMVLMPLGYEEDHRVVDRLRGAFAESDSRKRRTSYASWFICSPPELLRFGGEGGVRSLQYGFQAVLHG